MSNMSAGQAMNNIRNIDDSRKQALHALISTLSPADPKDASKLDEDQASKLSERLSQILGDPEADVQETRNERGELLNEEGLPIIDISEPANEEVKARQPPNPFFIEQDPTPLSLLTEQERLALRAKTNRLLDILEAEEEQELQRDDELELQRQKDELAKRKEDAKAEKERKLAAREMQKRMGKALLRNLAEQRQKEETQKASEELKVPEKSSQNGDDSKKPQKRVSFANVGDIRENEPKPKPKPALAWGDVSVGSLKGNPSRVRLKASDIARQPLKPDVVERVPGSEGLVAPGIQDSDDESDRDGQVVDEETDEDVSALNSGAYMQSDSDSSDSADSSKDNEEEDELDFSQARLQREIALEYLKMRGTIGAEAYEAMSSHAFTGENEWDQPVVPLEATLSSKPPKSNVSRFKASRHSAAVSADNTSTSVSLGPSVLPSGDSHALKRVVRTGKLSDGKLVGGEAGESASEDENDENRRRMLALLKSGVPISFEDTDPLPDQTYTRQAEDTEASNGDQIPKMSTTTTEGLPTSTSTPSAPKKSKFLLDRDVQRTSSAPASGPSGPLLGPAVASTSRLSVNSPSSTVLGDVAEKRASSSNVQPIADQVMRGGTTQPMKPFKKPPTVVSVPVIAPSQRDSRSSPKVPPDAAVLSTMIVDSPSFPPPNSTASKALQSSPILGEVRESVRAGGTNPDQQKAANGKGARVSRFKAERS